MPDLRAQLTAALAGRYEIDREIGRGGMATVYLARDVKHERPVAVKLLDPELGAMLGAERFLSEIRVTANLQHPNLLPLFDSGEADGLLFYVMPYVEGESLRRRMEREKQLPVDDAVRIAVSVCSALDYAHERGIIHRDLKPENVLLQHGQPVVADFGIALAVSKAGGARVTQTGLSLGTPQYMSPEQATRDRTLDGRTDIYSLGAVTYEMLAGEPPHTGGTAQAVIARLMTEEPRPLTTVRRNVPAHVDAAVRCALEKLPADRFATAARFAEALQGARPVASGASMVTTRGGRSTNAHRAIRSLPWLVSGAAIVAAVLSWSTRKPADERVERYDLTTLGVKPIGSAPTAYVGPTLALSADGGRIAYVSRDSTNTSHIWIRDIDDLASRRVAGTDGAESVTLSPDGNHVAFIQKAGLRVAPVSGGAVTTLAPDGATRPWWAEDGMIYFGSLSAAGERVARIPAFGGQIEPLASAAPYRDPSPLPGSNAVLITHVTSPNRIAVVTLPDGRVHDLTVGHRPRYVAPGYIVYMDGPNFGEPGRLVAAPFDARRLELTGSALPVVDQAPAGVDIISQYAVAGPNSLVYMSGTGRTNELVWVGRDGVARAVDSSFQGSISSPALSRDGSRVAVTNNGSIWIKQLDRGSAFNLSVGSGLFPAWTADGRGVSYVATDSGTTRGLVTKPADGSAQAVPLRVHKTGFVESVWSRDGQWLVGTAVRVGNARGVYSLRPGADTIPTPIAVDTKTFNAEPALSPDGRWLAFASNRTGQYEVYVVPFPGAATRWVVSTNGGSEPVWSPRGDELFYRDAADNLVGVKVTTGDAFTFGRATTLFSAAEYRKSENHQQYDVSRDGKSFLMVRRAPGGPPPRVVLVKSWLQDSKRRSGAK